MGCNCGKSSFTTQANVGFSGQPQSSASPVSGVPVAPPAPQQTSTPLSGISAPVPAGQAFVR